MGQPADLERTRTAGFDEHLTKPANPEALFGALATLRNTGPQAVALRSLSLTDHV
jgi:CheY-like chemotaxis protein